MANTFKFGNGNWAVKKDSVLAYNDENNNFKPLPFDFTRNTIATYVDSDGLIKTASNNEARIDYTDNANGHLLLEPSRTNLITNSEKFVDAVTGNTNMDLFSGTITNNNTTSPDGNNKGMKFTISTGSTATLRIYQSDLSTSADTTFSIYAKSGTTNSLSINVAGGTATSVTTTSEWQRVITTDTSNSNKFFDVVVSGSVGDYIYIFGMQGELGSYATSYIPTNGQSVTRAADSCEGAGNSEVFNDSEGVLYAEVKSNNDSVNRFISVRDDDFSDRVAIVILTNNNIYGQVRAGSSTVFFRETSGIDTETYNKIAISYKTDETKLFVNGIQVGSTDTSVTMPSGLNALEFFDGAGNDGFYGNIKDLKVYNTALTDAELITLTT